MRARTWLASVMALVLLPAVVSAKEGWRNLGGKRCPAFNVATWLNTDGQSPQPGDLDGQVWLLEFLSAG